MKQITSIKHPVVHHFLQLKKQASYRKEHSSVLVEGKNLVKDLVKKYPIKRLFITNPEDAVPAEEVFLVSSHIIEKITSVRTPEGMLGEVLLPKETPVSGKRLIACDGIQDPGNLGTILRTALALGWDGCLLLEGCCDPYNDKALRAAKGATFFLPLQKSSWDDLRKRSVEDSAKIILTMLHGSPPEAFSSLENIILVFGNESRGATPPKDLESLSLTIPIHNIDSLNVAVAAGISMYALKKGGL